MAKRAVVNQRDVAAINTFGFTFAQTSALIQPSLTWAALAHSRLMVESYALAAFTTVNISGYRMIL
jgi:hypothetical protein